VRKEWQGGGGEAHPTPLQQSDHVFLRVAELRVADDAAISGGRVWSVLLAEGDDDADADDDEG
jgi:hypothetical protein